MNKSRFTTTHLLIVTIAVFAVGVVIDMAIVSPKLSKIKMLAAERQTLEAQMQNIAANKSHEGDMASALGLQNLEILLTEPTETSSPTSAG